MPIKYVGPKVLISKSGIEFDTNKEDKYVYLNIALQLLKAIDHEYIEDRLYTYTTDNERVSDDEMSHLVKAHCPDAEALMARASQRSEAYVSNLLKRARENRVIDEVEREVLIKNIRLMHSYIVQRGVNKAVYYCIIEELAEKLKGEHIDYVITPFYQTFAHVLHSVQGVLIAQRFPINSNIEIFEEEGRLMIKLDVINQ
jgi:hypothetical protein